MGAEWAERARWGGGGVRARGGMEEVKWGGGGCELGDANDDDEDDEDDEPCS